MHWAQRRSASERRATAYAEIPPRVVYELTELGWQLRPVLDAMYAWGMAAPVSAFTSDNTPPAPAHAGSDPHG